MVLAGRLRPVQPDAGRRAVGRGRPQTDDGGDDDIRLAHGGRVRHHGLHRCRGGGLSDAL